MVTRLNALKGRSLYFRKFLFPSTSRIALRSTTSTNISEEQLSSLPLGLQKLAKMEREEVLHINPGPPTTYDDVPIPFKPIEEAKKDFMPIFNLYFWSSLVLFTVTCYWAFVIEDLWMYDARAPVKSYRDRHKGRKPSERKSPSGGVVSTAAAAFVGEDNKKESTESGEEDTQINEGVGANPAVVRKTTQREESQVTLERSDGKKGMVAIDPNKLPEEIPYLLIGAGTAAYYAALAIRARDADAKVLMIGDERHSPYNRPPLSKELWWYGDDHVAETLEYKTYSGKKRDVYFEAPGFFVAPGEIELAEHGGVSLLSGHRVVKLDLVSHNAYLEDGRSIKYQKCLIATGGHPKSLSVIENAGDNVKRKVTSFRTIDDFRNLEELAKKIKSVAIIGGSFLGSELANSLNRRFGKKGLQIYQIFREKGNVAEVLPEFMSKYVTSQLRKSGVNVMSEKEVKCITVDKSDKVCLQLTTGEVIKTDHVITAVGIDANTDLAKSSGLEVDPENGGYVVDAELRARSDVWIAGDASSFYDTKLGRRRVEHWEHAQITGRLAGENMTGANKPYWHQSSYYSTIAPNVHFEAVGRTSSHLRTVSVLADNKPKNEEITRGVVFYLDNKIIVGVLLLNVIGPGIDIARRLIADGHEHNNFKEVAKLFDLHKSMADSEEK